MKKNVKGCKLSNPLKIKLKQIHDVYQESNNFKFNHSLNNGNSIINGCVNGNRGFNIGYKNNLLHIGNVSNVDVGNQLSIYQHEFFNNFIDNTLLKQLNCNAICSVIHSPNWFIH